MEELADITKQITAVKHKIWRITNKERRNAINRKSWNKNKDKYNLKKREKYAEQKK